MESNSSASINPISSSIDRDFSDIVQGEELEFRESKRSTFKISHNMNMLVKSQPPSILSKFSDNQLVTLSGAISGFLAGVVVCPLDVVKTRLQAQGAMQKSASDTSAKYRGFLGAFKTILREEGVRGLYRGLVPITIGYLPTWTIYFTVYERAKKIYPTFLHTSFGINNDSLNHFCSAVTAGMASSIAVNPVWVVKTRLMVQTGKEKVIYNEDVLKPTVKMTKVTERTFYKGTLDAFKKMYQEEGIRVFYSGLIPSLFGLVHVGIHFPVYEKLKSLLHCNVKPNEDLGKPVTPKGLLWRLISASAFSKMIASTLTYPHEILRTRMQIQASKEDMKKKVSGRLVDSITSIYKKEGLKGFYAGYGINLARTVPASAVTLVSFEYFKTYLLTLSGRL